MVHQYQLNGYNIVLDTCSGSIHAVDEVAYDIIAMFEDKTEAEIVSAITEKHGVTAEEVKECLEDVAFLKENKKQPKSCFLFLRSIRYKFHFCGLGKFANPATYQFPFSFSSFTKRTG